MSFFFNFIFYLFIYFWHCWLRSSVSIAEYSQESLLDTVLLSLMTDHICRLPFSLPYCIVNVWFTVHSDSKVSLGIIHSWMCLIIVSLNKAALGFYFLFVLFFFLSLSLRTGLFISYLDFYICIFFFQEGKINTESAVFLKACAGFVVIVLGFFNISSH